MLKKIVTVNGETLTIPELKYFEGKKVEITLKELKKKKRSPKNLQRYFGSLRFEGDPLEFQKKLREEWQKAPESF